MLSMITAPDGTSIGIKESCGLRHELQVVALPALEELPEKSFALRDSVGGKLYPVQPARSQAGKVFTLLALAPFQELRLTPGPAAVQPEHGADIVEKDGVVVLSNGLATFEIESDKSQILRSSFPAGPVRRFRKDGHPWRGTTYFDVPCKPERFSLEILEVGPVRAELRWRLEFEAGRFYEATITLDAGQSFARFAEHFACGADAQLVWDFAGSALPARVRLLDPTEGCRPVIPNLHMDNRLARLFAWTQGSQLFDLSDGFGLLFQAGDEAGFVTLEGGAWTGSQLNHMELWMRRVRPGDLATRRGLPPDAKADSNPSPEAIPARGDAVCEPHVDVEGWLRGGRRIFALTVADKTGWGYVTEDAMNAEPDPFKRQLFAGSGHFMSKVSHLADSPGQYHLRKLHAQRGIMSLQAMLAMSFAWPREAVVRPAFGWPHPAVANQHGASASGDERADAHAMLDYIQTRVHAFWDVSGPGATNPVSGRRIAPELFRFEYLLSRGVLTEEEILLGRALFAFLVYLYSSDNYYPGQPPMLPMSDPDSFEPTIAGMSNQNFYTDVINGEGIAAQLFTRHPMAGRWREHFGAMLKQQLAYHVYPASGVWEESHTYFLHVLITVLPTLARRRADGVDDFFADPAFQKLAGYAVILATPRDAMFDGRRHVAPLGDHDPERKAPLKHCEMYAQLAGLFRQSAPELSNHLAWLCGEYGGQIPAGQEAKAPAWESEYAQGLGYFFRGRAVSGDEELLILRCGSAWGHHHNDDGSIQFYGKGRAWISDAACGNVAMRGGDKHEARGHSRWEPDGLSALSHLWRFNRGWIEAQGRAPDGGEWAVAYAPLAMSMHEPRQYVSLRSLIKHRRTVVKLASCLYLVIDTLELPERNIVRYHVPTFETELALAENRVTFQSGGTALDIAALPVEDGAIRIWDCVPLNCDAAKFATKCAEFDCGTGCLCVSALNLRASTETPLRLARTPRGFQLEARGSSWSGDFCDLRKLAIRTPAGSSCEIEIGDVGFTPRPPLRRSGED